MKLYKKLFKNSKKELTKKCEICDKAMDKPEEIRVLKCNHRFHANCVDLYTNKYYTYACWKCGKNHS